MAEILIGYVLGVCALAGIVLWRLWVRHERKRRPGKLRGVVRRLTKAQKRAAKG